MSNSKVISIPSQKTVLATRAALDGATLQTLAAVAGEAGATLSRMSGVATVIKAGIVDTVLRVVSKESAKDVVEPVKGAIGAAGKVAPNLSTIRSAIIKMIVAYGADHALPMWTKVAEAKDSGDAAVTAAVGACITYSGKDAQGVPTGAAVDAEVRDAVLEKINSACVLFGLSEDSAGKLRGQYFTALQGMVEDADAAEQAASETPATPDANGDAAIVADAMATMQAELDELRAIAAEMRRITGIETTDNTAALILLQEFAAADIESEVETTD